ncbi:hypothetical protein GEMRC1_003653 [Eukaryota sp. GEM-RC1]
MRLLILLFVTVCLVSGGVIIGDSTVSRCSHAEFSVMSESRKTFDASLWGSSNAVVDAVVSRNPLRFISAMQHRNADSIVHVLQSYLLECSRTREGCPSFMGLKLEDLIRAIPKLETVVDIQSLAKFAADHYNIFEDSFPKAVTEFAASISDRLPNIDFRHVLPTLLSNVDKLGNQHIADLLNLLQFHTKITDIPALQSCLPLANVFSLAHHVFLTEAPTLKSSLDILIKDVVCSEINIEHALRTLSEPIQLFVAGLPEAQSPARIILLFNEHLNTPVSEIFGHLTIATHSLKDLLDVLRRFSDPDPTLTGSDRIFKVIEFALNNTEFQVLTPAIKSILDLNAVLRKPMSFEETLVTLFSKTDGKMSMAMQLVTQISSFVDPDIAQGMKEVVTALELLFGGEVSVYTRLIGVFVNVSMDYDFETFFTSIDEILIEFEDVYIYNVPVALIIDEVAHEYASSLAVQFVYVFVMNEASSQPDVFATIRFFFLQVFPEPVYSHAGFLIDILESSRTLDENGAAVARSIAEFFEFVIEQNLDTGLASLLKDCHVTDLYCVYTAVSSNYTEFAHAVGELPEGFIKSTMAPLVSTGSLLIKFIESDIPTSLCDLSDDVMLIADDLSNVWVIGGVIPWTEVASVIIEMDCVSTETSICKKLAFVDRILSSFDSPLVSVWKSAYDFTCAHEDSLMELAAAATNTFTSVINCVYSTQPLDCLSTEVFTEDFLTEMDQILGDFGLDHLAAIIHQVSGIIHVVDPDDPFLSNYCAGIEAVAPLIQSVLGNSESIDALLSWMSLPCQSMTLFIDLIELFDLSIQQCDGGEGELLCLFLFTNFTVDSLQLIAASDLPLVSEFAVPLHQFTLELLPVLHHFMSSLDSTFAELFESIQTLLPILIDEEGAIGQFVLPGFDNLVSFTKLVEPIAYQLLELAEPVINDCNTSIQCVVVGMLDQHFEDILEILRSLDHDVTSKIADVTEIVVSEVLPLLMYSQFDSVDNICLFFGNLSSISLDSLVDPSSSLGTMLFDAIDIVNTMVCPVNHLISQSIELITPSIDVCLTSVNYSLIECVLLDVMINGVYVDVLDLFSSSGLPFVAPTAQFVAHVINIFEKHLLPVFVQHSDDVCQLLTNLDDVIRHVLPFNVSNNSWYNDSSVFLIQTVCDHQDTFMQFVINLMEAVRHCDFEVTCYLQSKVMDPVFALLIDAEIAAVSELFLDLLPYYLISFREEGKDYPEFYSPIDFLLPLIDAEIPIISDQAILVKELIENLYLFCLMMSYQFVRNFNSLNLIYMVLFPQTLSLAFTSSNFTPSLLNLFVLMLNTHLSTIPSLSYTMDSNLCVEYDSLSVACGLSVSILEGKLLRALDSLQDTSLVSYPAWIGAPLNAANFVHVNQDLFVLIISKVSESSVGTCFGTKVDSVCLMTELIEKRLFFEVARTMTSLPHQTLQNIAHFAISLDSLLMTFYPPVSSCHILRELSLFVERNLVNHWESLSPIHVILDSMARSDCFATDIQENIAPVIAHGTKVLHHCKTDYMIMSFSSYIICLVENGPNFESSLKPIVTSLRTNYPETYRLVHPVYKTFLSTESNHKKISSMVDSVIGDLNLVSGKTVSKFLHAGTHFEPTYSSIYLLDNYLSTLIHPQFSHCLKHQSPLVCVLNSIAVTLSNDNVASLAKNYRMFLRTFGFPTYLFDFVDNECNGASFSQRLSQCMFFSKGENSMAHHHPSLPSFVTSFECEIVDLFGADFYKALTTTTSIPMLAIQEGFTVTSSLMNSFVSMSFASYIINFTPASPSSVVIPSYILMSIPGVSDFDLYARGRNGLNWSAAKSITVEMNDEDFDIEVSIRLLSEEVAYEPLVLSLDRKLLTCGSYRFHSQTITWTSSIDDVSSSTNRLIIPRKLAVPGDHSFGVTVRTTVILNGESRTVEKSASVTVTLASPSLVVSFTSGSSALVSSARDFRLEAETSIPKQNCKFYWYCSGDCPSIWTASDPANISDYEHVLLISSGHLEPNKHMVITVKVIEQSSDVEATATFSLSTNKAQEAFAVSIKSLPRMISSSERLVLEAEVDGALKSIQWTAEPDVLLPKNLLSPLGRRVLVLKPNVLSHSQTVKFTVTATSTSDTVTFASVEVSTRSRPTPGRLTITPSTGVALTDYFTIAHFTDSDRDSYQWFIARGNALVSLSRTTESNSIRVMLPPGQQSNDHQVTIVGRLIDPHGVVSDPVTITATVTPPVANTEKVYEHMEEVSNNIDRDEDVGSQISTVAETLNSMDRDDGSEEVRRRVRQQLATELEGASAAAKDSESVSSTSRALQSVVNDGKELDQDSRSSSGRTLSTLAQSDHSDEESDVVLVSVADSLIADSDDEVSETVVDSVDSIARRSTSRLVCGQAPFEAAGKSLGIKSAKHWNEDLTDGLTGIRGEDARLPVNFVEDDCLGYRSVSVSNDHRSRGVSATGSFSLSVTSATDNDLEVAELEDPIVISLGKAEEHGDDETVECKYWNRDEKRWSTEGVETVYDNGEVVCKTSHLTTFAGIVSKIPDGPKPDPSSGSSIWILFVVIAVIAIGGAVGFVLWRKKATRTPTSMTSNPFAGQRIEMSGPRNVPGNVV